MARLGSVPVDVRLKVGSAEVVIGSIPVTLKSGPAVVLNREALVQVNVDNIRPDLAALLRAAADEIEHPDGEDSD